MFGFLPDSPHPPTPLHCVERGSFRRAFPFPTSWRGGFQTRCDLSYSPSPQRGEGLGGEVNGLEPIQNSG